jgi:hypothetical protein
MAETEAAGPEDQLVIEISPALSFKGGAYDQLRLHEPSVGQVRKAEGSLRNGIHAESLRVYHINLIAAVSGWPVPAVEMMPVTKMNEAANFLARFTMAGAETGGS